MVNVTFRTITSSFLGMDTVTNTNETSFDPDDLGYTPEPNNTLEHFLNVIKLLIGLVGAVGNGLVCYVIFKVRKQQNYTNSLIVSQAAIDFLTSLILIATTISFAVDAQPPSNHGLAVIFCIFWHGRIFLFSCWAISTFNLVAIAIERYLAIIHPIWYHQTFTRKHAWILATMAWLIAPIMQTILGARQLVLRDGQCEAISTPKEQAILGVLVFLWDYFIPLAIMTFAFICIGIRLNQLKTPPVSESNNNHDNEVREKIMKRRNVTKTLFTVFALYVICWSPEQITFLQFNLGGKLEFGGVWHSIALILAISNSAVNPFVYALRFKQYKQGVKSLLSKLKTCSHL